LDADSLIARASKVFEHFSVPARLAVLFGSRARGTAGPASDVDIGFIPAGEISLGQELALEAELTRALGAEVDLVRLDVEDVMLRYRVAKDGIVILAHPAFEAPRFFARAAVDHDEMAPLFADACRRFAQRLAGGAR
jgi:predicted nucleotidyltransferase